METITNPKLTNRLKKRYSANFDLKLNNHNLFIDDIFVGKTNLKKIEKWKIQEDKIILYGVKNDS